MSKPRFTLRPEYFGGIVHDKEKLNCTVFQSDAFNFLQDLAFAENGLSYENKPFFTDCNHDSYQAIRVFIDIGMISFSENICFLNNFRLIKPDIVPENCLVAPLRVYDTFTRRCNLNCPQCLLSSTYNFSEKRRSLAETKLIIKKFYEAGTPEWRFTGGEPTSCPDFLEAVFFAKEQGMAIMVNTNGCWDERTMRELPEAGINDIIVSLEGREETNDRRRSPGVFKKIIKTFDRIDECNRGSHNVRVTVNMTVARDNAHDLEYVIRLAAKRGYNVNFVPLRPYGRTATDLKDQILSTEEFRDFSKEVQELREDREIVESEIKIIHKNMDLFCPDYPDSSVFPFPLNYSICGALSTGFGICPSGRVNACSFLMDDENYLGPNMIEASVSEAWLHSKMENVRQAKKVGCVSCSFYMNQCEGKCTAMVLANGGKIENGCLLGNDPYCFRHLMPKK